MKLVKKILLGILGIEGYIKLASRVYIWLVLHGFLRKKYPELFYLEQIVKPGSVVIDIGANLGYYSVKLSKLAGENGKVYAVEPIQMFYNVWKNNVKNSGFDNLQLCPYALGSETKTVQMGMPEKEGLLHHGMTKITSLAQEKYVQLFDVQMRNPDELFNDLTKLDFVKCDVEGYESEVFSNMKSTLKKFLPIVQSELSGKENRIKVIAIFTELGYKANILDDSNTLIPVDEVLINHSQKDFYFVPVK